MKDIFSSEALEMLAEVTDASGFGLDTEFSSLHLDSLQITEWISRLEAKLNVDFDFDRLDFSEFGDSDSISEIVEMLQKRAANTPSN